MTLAVSIAAHLILSDDRKGKQVALKKRFEAAGTLGSLLLQSRRGLVNLQDAFDRLECTNFRCRPEVMHALLRRESVR